MRVLTKYPSVGLHFVPIIKDIDAHSEANKLQDRTCKAQLNHKVRVSSSSLLYFSRLLLLHDQLLLEFLKFDLVFAKQCPLVNVLVDPRLILNLLGPSRKLKRLV